MSSQMSHTDRASVVVKVQSLISHKKIDVMYAGMLGMFTAGGFLIAFIYAAASIFNGFVFLVKIVCVCIFIILLLLHMTIYHWKFSKLEKEAYYFLDRAQSEEHFWADPRVIKLLDL
jgi:uncharacterized protein YacL